MNEKEQELKNLIENIRPLDPRYVEASKKRWNSIAKPLHSLGKLEDAVMKISGMTRSLSVRINKRALLVMCADNGVVAEGVTQTGQEVTAIVAENFLQGNTSAAIMCSSAKVDLFPVDVGMAVDTKVPRRKVARGTADFLKKPAMTREETVETILTGLGLVKEKVDQGYNIIATGEMGIGNTTTSSGVASVLLHLPVEKVTGRGAGLDDRGLIRKREVICQAIALHQPDQNDPIDVLSKIGGFDLAALTGIFLGGALYQVPVILDGFISGVAALTAYNLCTYTRDYMLASHVSKEPATHYVLEALGLSPVIHGDLCLGEGTGAVAFLPLLDMAVKVYEEMSTFSEIDVPDYEDYENVAFSDGGSGSGKSEYGENWLTQKNDGQTRTSLREAPFLYIATMEPFGEEAKKRIRRHRKMRAFKGFHTVECYRNLSQLNISCKETKKYAGVLLECMSNLVANELYLPDGTMRGEESVIEAVLMGLENLKRQTDTIVIITNEVTADGIQYSLETRIYQQVLGRINQALAGQADLVTEVVYGIPIRLKDSN